MLRLCFLVLIGMHLAGGTGYGQEVRQTTEGRDIVVNPDGTWRYADAATSPAGPPDPRQLVLQLAETAAADAERYEGEYRAAVRNRALAEADFTTAKVDPAGSKQVQEEARAAFQQAKALEATTLDRYELARSQADKLAQAAAFPDKKLLKFLSKQGYALADTPGTPASTGAKKAEKARRKAENAAAKLAQREAKLADKEPKEKRTTEPPIADGDKAVRKAEKLARKEARKAAKRAAKGAKNDGIAAAADKKRRPKAPKERGQKANKRPPASVADVRISRPEDYAQYDPQRDIMLNPPGGDCRIVFDGEDSFSGKYRKETAPQLLFAYTPKQLQAYITDRDYVTAYGSIIRIAGGLQLLILDLYVAAENADRAFGTIPRNGQLNIKTLDGENVLLLNSKTVRGRWDAKKQLTHYRAQYIVDKEYEQQLTNSEVDEIRIVWETGYDDVPVYELDFFRDQFACLNAKL